MVMGGEDVFVREDDEQVDVFVGVVVDLDWGGVVCG